MLRRSLSFAWAVALAALLLAGVEKALIAAGHPTAQMINALAIAGGIVALWAVLVIAMQEAGRHPERWRRIMSGDDDAG